MQNSLFLVGLVVLAFWVAIMGIYLVTARKQVSIEATINEIERDLDERTRS